MDCWINSVISFVSGAILPSIGWLYQYRKDKKKEKQEEALRKSANVFI